MNDDAPTIGTRNDKGWHQLLAEVGVVHTENGKPADKLWERWKIDCSNQDHGLGKPFCTFDTLSVSSLLSLPTSGPWVRTFSGSTSDGTVPKVNLNWDGGEIDFSVAETAGLFTKETSDTEVQQRFRWVGDIAYLVSLRLEITSDGPAQRVGHG
jgi:hypothetical protein